MLIIFDCTKAQIAHIPEQINENTRAYLGPWNIETFKIIRDYPNITHLYESFPDKKIFLTILETDPAINSPAKAQEQGLELCPADVGPHLRLQYTGKDWKLIAMKQITGRDGSPGVFDLDSDGAQLRLIGDVAEPAFRWLPDSQFVFCFRK